MKIAIFGASGGIGKFVLHHALEQGFEVSAYLRNPSKLALSHQNLVLTQGELNNYDLIKQAMVGCEAVICAIGVPMKFSYPTMDSLEGHKNILKAMKDLKISRLIDWATPSVPYKDDKKSFITVIPGFMAGILFPKAKKELLAISNIIQQADVSWTIVRFMAPTDTAFTGKIKVGFGDVKMRFNIARTDIAYFMVQQVSSPTYIGSMPIIGS